MPGTGETAGRNEETTPCPEDWTSGNGDVPVGTLRDVLGARPEDASACQEFTRERRGRMASFADAAGEWADDASPKAGVARRRGR
jgi:hypothetical protein